VLEYWSVENPLLAGLTLRNKYLSFVSFYCTLFQYSITPSTKSIHLDYHLLEENTLVVSLENDSKDTWVTRALTKYLKDAKNANVEMMQAAHQPRGGRR